MQGKLKKLLIGMIYFLVAILLTVGIFWGIWHAFLTPADIEESSAASSKVSNSVSKENDRTPMDPALSMKKALQTETEKETGQKPTIAAAPQQQGEDGVETEATPALPLQGPQAGDAVLPPSRNVTPGYESSPLAQTEPLKREVGNPIPAPPKRTALPPFFRKVAIVDASRVMVRHRSDQVTISLANIKSPDEEQNCVMFGQTAKCKTLAKTALQRFLRGRGISCEISQEQLKAYRERKAEGEHLTGLCVIGRKNPKTPSRKVALPDLGEWLVRYGWAIPQNGHYQTAHDIAKSQNRGIYGTANTASSLTDRRLSGQTQSKLDQLAKEAVASTPDEQPVLDLIAEPQESDERAVAETTDQAGQPQDTDN